MKVHLTYFKHSGTYYTDGEYETEKIHLFEIFEEVRDMALRGERPGLMPGRSNFIILIDVPEHEHNHPHLVIIKE